ncbi:MAG TPA: methanol/ethanol family PQQ-dependent dehydrogenase [Vicinamibacterales bacterium]|nr:methanol/ethanol family PQQ-dependent dehydrogenase [Vicinamibacterales bacterium]
MLTAACRSGPDKAPRPSNASGTAPTGGTLSVGGTIANDWTMAPGDYAATRFSTLADINTGNVSQLKEAWTFATGTLGGQEAAPLVVGNTMYIVTPFPNTLYALDLTKPGAPIKWRYDPDPQGAAKGVACCDTVNRGAAYADGRVFINTLDGFTVGVDAATGQQLWKTQLGDINLGETITMAPMVVKGKVLVGNSGGEFGVRGWLTAVDAASGKIAWRAYNTGPDRDVLIGPNFKPYYDSDKGADLGEKTWPSEAWKTGGATVWGWISYDPELDLIFYGTSNPGPWNAEQRPGDNKWSSGIFARDPDDGDAKWYYQFSPHDLYDFDAVNENILVTLTVNGQSKPVIIRPERNGYVYILDRTTGQVLSATPFVHITSSTGVDLKTGRLQYVKEKGTRAGAVVRDICPASPGAKDWQPSSFSPRTGLLYMPHNNLCMDYEGMETSYIAGTPYVGAELIMKPGPGGHLGEVTAWDPVKAQPAWKIKEQFMAWSGTLVTAGDVVFYGTMDGWFKAVDARTGSELWKTKTASGVIGQPISYRGPDGKQYIAILAGIGGWPGAVIVNELDTRDPTAAGGWGETMKALQQMQTKGGMLHVFSLP